MPFLRFYERYQLKKEKKTAGFMVVLSSLFSFLFSAIVLVGLFLPVLNVYCAYAPPLVHVVVAQKLKTVDIAGYELKRMLFHHRDLKKFSGNKSIKFNCLGLPPKKGLLAMVSSPSGVVDWNGVKYAGEFLIVGDDKGEECSLVNRTSIESYLTTLLPKEMNKDWPMEALKAQAVVARSYALFKIRERRAKVKESSESLKKGASKKKYYDLVNSEMDQVSGSMIDSGPKVTSAVMQTKGEVLTTISGEMIPTFFHSKCGGKTLLPESVWKNKIDGYQSVECPYCQKYGKQSWRYVMPVKEFDQLIKTLIKKYYGISLSGQGELKWEKDSFLKNDLVIKGQYKTVNMKKTLIRRYLGREKIFGNYINIQSVPGSDEIIIDGEGNGHGVGMCQFGALYLADRGRTYREILKYYFPNFIINRAYE